MDEKSSTMATNPLEKDLNEKLLLNHYPEADKKTTDPSDFLVTFIHNMNEKVSKATDLLPDDFVEQLLLKEDSGFEKGYRSKTPMEKDLIMDSLSDMMTEDTFVEGPPGTTPGCTRTVFIGNLSPQSKQSDVLEFLKEVGQPIHIMQMFRKDKSPRGFTYVSFSSVEEAEKALQLDGIILDGRVIRVLIASDIFMVNLSTLLKLDRYAEKISKKL